MDLRVVELRQYQLKPGRTDDLIEVFDRELVETQEACGMHVLGQYRDLDRPDRFVWVRRFPDMAARRAALTAFYSGPVWKEHAAAANATMIDVDDVLLLRPVRGFGPLGGRPAAAGGDSVVSVTIYLRDRPFDEEFFSSFEQAALPALACYTTEYAENDYPALPVRSGEHAFVWFARSASPEWTPEGVTVEHRRLAPTPRSRLR